MENKTFDQMNLLDSFLFGTTLGYEEYGKEVSGIILKTILRRKVKIKKVVSEMVIFPTKPGLHGVRLDAFVEEDDTEVATGSIYDLEPDKKESEKYHLSKRVRYYHSKIDMHYLEASEKYKKLPQVWVIFITSFDPFDQNRLVYTIKNHCVEVPDMDYDDGATTLLLYVDGDPEGYPKELVQLLAYMKNSIPENVCNPDLAQIHSCVDKVKKDPKVREVFVTLEEYVEREKAEVLEEAERKIAEERKRVDEALKTAAEEKARANEAEKKAIEEKSRADKADRQIVASIRMIMSLSEKTADSAMNELGIDVEMRDYYKAML